MRYFEKVSRRRERSMWRSALVGGALDAVSFDDFRERFRAWLTSTNVVRDALGRLTSHPRGDVRSNPSLIRCAAARAT